VHWPGGGTQEAVDVKAGKIIEITEPGEPRP
jgi:hypothetical protein